MNLTCNYGESLPHMHNGLSYSRGVRAESNSKGVQSLSLSVCGREKCHQPVFGETRLCYYHDKQNNGLFGIVTAFSHPTLTGEQRKEIDENEILIDPKVLEGMAERSAHQPTAHILIRSH